jgi:hypothetical protein
MQHSQIYLASVDVTGGITSMWNTFTTWVPRFVGFLAILVIGWFIAKLIGKAVEAVLRRVHFERVMERSGTSRMLENSKYDGSSLCGAIAKYVVLLIVLQLAFGVFGSNPINDVIHSIIAWIPRGLVALAIVVVTALIARVVRDLVSSALSSLSYGRTLGNLAALCIMFLGVVAALGQAEIATSITGPLLVAVLATVAGVVIVGVGGGMVRPMQDRWERMLGHAEREAGNVMAAAQASGSMGSGSMRGGSGSMGEGASMAPGASSSRAASSGEAYSAGHSDAAAAAEEAARRARQNPPAGSGGGMGGDDRGGV